MLPSLGSLKSVGSGLLNVARGSMFMGPSQGASTAGKVMNGLGHTIPLAPAAAGSFKATSQQPAFKPQSTLKTAVSEDWIKKRIAQAVENGATNDQLEGFYQRQQNASNNAFQRWRDIPWTQEKARDIAQKALDQHSTAAMTAANSFAKQPPYVAPTPTPTSNKALAGKVGLGLGAVALGYGAYRALKPKKESGSPRELNPVIEQAIRAKIAAANDSPSEPTPGAVVHIGKQPGSLPKSMLLGSFYGAIAGPNVSELGRAVSQRTFNPSGGHTGKEALIGGLVGGVVGGVSHATGHTVPAPWPFQKRAKIASETGWHRPINALSYAAFAAPYVSQSIHDNKPLSTALNTAGLLGLGATSAHSLAQGDNSAGYDLAGLGLMGAGMLHNTLRPSPVPGAGH